MSGFPGRACGVEKRDGGAYSSFGGGCRVCGHLGQGGDSKGGMLGGAALQAG
jgi:hypothetical protein